MNTFNPRSALARKPAETSGRDYTFAIVMGVCIAVCAFAGAALALYVR